MEGGKFSILFPPPHSPVGLQWTPPDSTGLHWTEIPGGDFRTGGLIFRWSPVDSTWTRLHKIHKKAKYPVHWTPLDSTWTQLHKIHKKAKYPVQWTPVDWTT